MKAMCQLAQEIISKDINQLSVTPRIFKKSNTPYLLILFKMGIHVNKRPSLFINGNNFATASDLSAFLYSN